MKKFGFLKFTVSKMEKLERRKVGDGGKSIRMFLR